MGNRAAQRRNSNDTYVASRKGKAGVRCVPDRLPTYNERENPGHYREHPADLHGDA